MASSFSKGIEAKLVVTNSDDERSQFLFARLSSDIVDALLLDAARCLDRTRNYSDPTSVRVGRASWSIDKANTDFLPLEFKIDGTRHYTSFNGGLLDDHVSSKLIVPPPQM